MITQMLVGVGLTVLLSLLWLALHRYAASNVESSEELGGDDPACTSRCAHCHCGRFPDDERSPSTGKDSNR